MEVEIKKDEAIASATLSIAATTREEFAVLKRFFERARGSCRRREYPLINAICEQLRTLDEPALDDFAKAARSYWED